MMKAAVNLVYLLSASILIINNSGTMKTINILKSVIFTVTILLSIKGASQFSPIVPNTTPQTDSCSVPGGSFDISVPLEALTGANIPLNITLPGTLDANCNVGVSIEFSPSLNFVASGNVNFNQNGNILTSTTPLAGNDGQNFNVFFKFPGYVTCNATVGTFTVRTTGCNGEVCITTVNVRARAENYWTIEKKYITGDLICGTSLWRHRVKLNNPNPQGQGTYSIQGSITETTALPIVSGATHTFSGTGGNNSLVLWGSTVLQNCDIEGSVITNTADYSYTLGNGCNQESGTVTASSPPLEAPNGSISFVKNVYSNSGGATSANNGTLPMTEGCDGRYDISVYNNGNVPWTNLTITDDFNIPGLSVTSMTLNAGDWNASPAISPIQQTQYTFTTVPNFVLNPGESTYIRVYFTVDSPNTIGNIITNTAYLTYQAYVASTNNGNGNTPIVCENINCPTLDTTLQNTTATVNVEVVPANPIPIIKKCIENSPPGGIYQLGDTVSFKILVGNKGSGNLTTTVSDNLQLPGQNLQVVPGSVAYSYHEDLSTYPTCGWMLNNPQPINFSTSDNLGTAQNPTNLQNPEFQITNMPGTCELWKANYTVITFDAIVLPQLYGGKTNKALLTSGQSSSAAYTIDQAGVLEIDKMADAQIVENGQNFNYVLTVSNTGTVPLDNIVISDNLPDCVNLSGAISVVDDLGTSVNYTTSGALDITLDPAVQILPGDDLVVTIPVSKSGSGTCCNITASVTAKMTTSGVDLYAIDDGNVDAPAACVTSTECCDITDFDATINTNGDLYEVQINGGATPIQEIEISMVDYHVSYTDAACQPQDLGDFGTLSTLQTTMDGSLLNNTENGTSSLTWLAGNPAIINSIVNLDIIDPAALNLDCCDNTFYFCLKVRVKDVNCNVCETTLCYSSDEEVVDTGDGIDTGDNGDGNDNGGNDDNHDNGGNDAGNTGDKDCDLVLKFVPEEAYCTGDTINLAWNSLNTSGLVDIVLTNGAGGSQLVIANGIPDNGSYNYTIPHVFDCEDSHQWSFIIRDTNNHECSKRTTTFDINCCEQECGCGKWLDNNVEIQISEEKLFTIDNAFPTSTGCGKDMVLSSALGVYSFTAPTYQCNPDSCRAKYEWTITNTTTGATSTFVGQTFEESNVIPGDIIKYTITPLCNGQRCKPCNFTIAYEK